MTFIYIPLAGGATLADALSRGVQRTLARPNAAPADVTTHAFGWLVHPESGAVVLELDEQQMVPTHVAADPQPLLDLLATLKDDLDQPLTTPEERAALAGVVQQFGGQRVPLSYLVPPKAMEGALTRADLEAGGWFPSEN